MTHVRTARVLLIVLPIVAAQFGTIKIDWTGDDEFSTPSLDLDRAPADEGADDQYPLSYPSLSEETVSASVDALRRMLARLGVARAGDEEALRSALLAALHSAKVPLLKDLLAEVDEACVGCTERAEYVTALLSSLERPVVARHGLPLFLYNDHLFPHTTKRMHFFEGRYKVLVERALLRDRTFGFVSTDNVGTLAHIDSWTHLEDGRSLVVVRGGVRFSFRRRWSEECDGCDSGPLHHGDVAFFNDTSDGDDLRAAELTRQSLVKYHVLTGSSVHGALQEQHGPVPATADGTYATSMWLSAACSSHPACAPASASLLITDSTAARLEAILRVQAALLGAPSAAPPSHAPSPPPPRLAASDQRIIASLASRVRLRALPSLLRSSEPDALHGKLLLLDEAVASEAHGSARLLLLAHEPAAAERVLRGFDLLSFTGKRVKDATRPEYLADMVPHVDELYVSHGGNDDAGRCGFVAMHGLSGLPHTRTALDGHLHLTDLQLDYEPSGGGAALRGLKEALGVRPSREARRAAVKMLVGCRAWLDLTQLQQQLDLGMWRLVEVTAGARELADAAIRTYKSEHAAKAVWQALWALL